MANRNFSKHLDPLVHTGLSCLKFKESTEIVPPHLSLPLPLALRPWEASLLCNSIIVYHDQQCWPAPIYQKLHPHSMRIRFHPCQLLGKARQKWHHRIMSMAFSARPDKFQTRRCFAAVQSTMHGACGGVQVHALAGTYYNLRSYTDVVHSVMVLHAKALHPAPE